VIGPYFHYTQSQTNLHLRFFLPISTAITVALITQAEYRPSNRLTIDLSLVEAQIVAERVTVVKFRTDYENGNGGSSFEVDKGADAA
jgi:hypothetical protein